MPSDPHGRWACGDNGPCWPNGRCDVCDPRCTSCGHWKSKHSENPDGVIWNHEYQDPASYGMRVHCLANGASCGCPGYTPPEDGHGA